MSRTLKLLATSAALLLNCHAAHAGVTLGAVVSHPEMVGAQASFYLQPALSLDAALSLTAADAGLSAHIPVGTTGKATHNVVVSALGGFKHAMVYDGTRRHGGRGQVALGYGAWLPGLELRAQLGYLAQHEPLGWVNAMAARLFVGWRL